MGRMKKGRGDNGTGSIRRRNDNRLEGRYYDENGVRQSIYAPDKETLRDELNQNIQQARVLKQSDLADISLQEIQEERLREMLQEKVEWVEMVTLAKGRDTSLFGFCVHWYEKVCNVKPGTRKNYKIYIYGHLQHHEIGSIPMRKISLNAFKSFFDEKKKGGRLDGRPGGLTPKSLRNMKNMLNEVMEYALHVRHYILYNPVNGLKLPKVKQPRIDRIHDQDVNKIIHAAEHFPDKLAWLIILDLCTGMRIGELTGILETDIGKNLEYIDLKYTLGRHDISMVGDNPEYIPVLNPYAKKNSATRMYLGPLKTGTSERRIYLNETAKTAVRNVRARQFILGLENKQGFAFLSNRGYPIEPRNYSKLFKKVLDAAGVSNKRFHQLRHTFASRAVDSDVDIATISEVLGHAQKSTTLNMYVHGDDDRKKAAMAKMDFA